MDSHFAMDNSIEKPIKAAYGEEAPPRHADFSDLPPEICNMIWKLLANNGRDIYLKFAVFRGKVHERAKVSLELDLAKITKQDMFPEVLHICSQSRRYAQKEGHFWFYHQELARATTLKDSMDFSGAYLNLNLDRFIIDCDFAVHPAKAKEYLLDALAGFQNIELWYDRVEARFDSQMLVHILAQAPKQLVVREVVDTKGNFNHPHNCYCSLCEVPEVDDMPYLMGPQGQDQDIDTPDDCDYYSLLNDMLDYQNDCFMGFYDIKRDTRLVRYEKEVDECRWKLMGCMVGDNKYPTEYAKTLRRKVFFERGTVSEIDWYKRERAKRGGAAMI